MKNRNVFIAVLSVITIFWTGIFFVAGAQDTNFSFEQLQRRLDSLELLQQESIRSGAGSGEYMAEIKQLQMAITTKNNELKAEIGRIIEGAQNDNIDTMNEEVKFDFFAKRPLWDNIVIVMGAIAVAAVLFLIIAKIILTVSRNKMAKKQNKPTKKDVQPKTANVFNEIDRYKEKETHKTEINESGIALLKELAKNEIKNEALKPEEEQPKKPPRAVDLKNEIVKRFDKDEDTAKIAQDLGISKDQVVMILSLAGRK
jgi:flagellar biosynthesis/type III secretory pathway M-ring protein FliF/YscJ